MKLSERLQHLQKTMATEKKTQYERLESKLHSLKQRIRDQQEIGDKKFKVVKEQLCKVSLQIESQRKQREEIFTQKKREAQTMQARVQQAIHEEFRTREEAEARMRKQV